jgi:hypothetical protein
LPGIGTAEKIVNYIGNIKNTVKILKSNQEALEEEKEGFLIFSIFFTLEGYLSRIILSAVLREFGCLCKFRTEYGAN